VSPVRYEHHLHIKSKAISVTGCGGLQACEILRIPYELDKGFTDVEVASLTSREPSIPKKELLSLVLISVRG
jgi:hypothetical protein